MLNVLLPSIILYNVYNDNKCTYIIIIYSSFRLCYAVVGSYSLFSLTECYDPRSHVFVHNRAMKKLLKKLFITHTIFFFMAKGII